MESSPARSEQYSGIKTSLPQSKSMKELMPYRLGKNQRTQMKALPYD